MILCKYSHNLFSQSAGGVWEGGAYRSSRGFGERAKAASERHLQASECCKRSWRRQWAAEWRQVTNRLVNAQKHITSREILLWMTPSEAPKALQASECSELLDPMRANCWIFAQH